MMISSIDITTPKKTHTHNMLQEADSKIRAMNKSHYRCATVPILAPICVRLCVCVWVKLCSKEK